MSFLLFYMLIDKRGNETDSGKPKYSEKKPVPVPLCPPQIPHGSIRDRTRASAGRAQAGD
jgi:hypothetical protein